MKMVLLRVLLASVLALTLASIVRADGNSFKTVARDKDGNPVPGVTLSVLSGGNKFAAGVTDANGQVNVSRTLGNVSANEEMQYVVRKCRHEDGKVTIEILMLPAGAQIPPQKNCDDYPAGLLPWPGQDGAVVTVNVDTFTAHGAPPVVPSGAVRKAKPENHLINVEVDGAVGLKRFSGANKCQSILVVLPAATCSSGDQSFAFSIGGTVKITRYAGVLVGYTRANAISRNAAASSPGPFTDKSTFQPSYFLVMPGIFLPIKRFTLFAEGGLAYHFISLKETQTSGSGGTVVSPLHENGAGPGVGGGFEVNATKQFGLRAEYQYLAARSNNLFSEHNHVVIFGAFFSFW